MLNSSPFRRVHAFIQALAAIASMPLEAQDGARNDLGVYRSRGKGLGRHSGRKPGNPGTLFDNRADHFRPHESKACFRRMRQIQRGTLQISA